MAALLCGMLAAKDFAVAEKGAIPEGRVQLAQNQSFADETFGGILAPEDSDQWGRPMPAEDPKGYPGLVPGTTPDYDWSSPRERPRQKQRPMSVKPGEYRSPFAPVKSPVPEKISTPALPKMTYAPWSGPPLETLTSEDLVTIARLSKYNISLNSLTPEMEERLGLPSGIAKAVHDFRLPRIDGMVPSEFAVKRSIDAVMSVVEGKSGASRRKAAEAAYDRLSQMASGYRSMKAVPQSVYKRFGAGDGYLEDQREGYNKALDRLEEALQALDKLK